MMISRMIADRRWLLPALFIALPLGGARAQTPPADTPVAETPPLMSLDDVRRGQLLFHAILTGHYAAAPLIATEVDIKVSGIVARTTVKQYFINPTPYWLEGRYVFPLPENAAVNHMKLVIGDRVIEAKIAKRRAAYRAYETAKKSGRRAALFEQHRPNIFSNNVANIPPGGRIAVQLHYIQQLRYDQGKFSLRFPLVVAPRFDPSARARRLITQKLSDNGDGMPPTLRAALPPIRVPLHNTDAAPPINPVTLRVTLDAGMALEKIASDSHEIVVKDAAQNIRLVTLATKIVPADRDFVLDWTPKLTGVPLIASFRERIRDHVYVLALIMPPRANAAPRREKPRDLVFVLDRSGSMSGESIRAARDALGAAIDRLSPADRFNLIRFSDQTESLFKVEQTATATNRQIAQIFLDETTPGGGTVMRPALRAALSGQAIEGRLRQIVFVTDGAVSNETELFREIRQSLGPNRLFTVGIGSAPNGYFMRRAAAAGRGSYVYIANSRLVQQQSLKLFAKLERPALTGISADWTAADTRPVFAENLPATIPDLYFGEPVVIVSRVAAAALDRQGALAIAGDGWKSAAPLNDTKEAQGIGTIWARAKIAALTDSLSDGASAGAVKSDITRIGLTHNLVTRHTSLLATEKIAARPQTAPLTESDAPINLPHGRSFGKNLRKSSNSTAGSDLQNRGATALPDPRHPAANFQSTPGTQTVTLPQGATPFFVHLFAGIGLLMTAGIGFLRTRLSRRAVAGPGT